MRQKIIKFILILLPINAIGNVMRNSDQSHYIVDSNENRRISRKFLKSLSFLHNFALT
jgi:lipopolysaccharide biosynthesis regulator YciM